MWIAVGLPVVSISFDLVGAKGACVKAHLASRSAAELGPKAS